LMVMKLIERSQLRDAGQRDRRQCLGPIERAVTGSSNASESRRSARNRIPVTVR